MNSVRQQEEVKTPRNYGGYPQVCGEILLDPAFKMGIQVLLTPSIFDRDDAYVHFYDITTILVMTMEGHEWSKLAS